MRRCLRNGNIVAFSVGLIVSWILPQCWLVILMAIILVIVSITCRHCCKY